MGDQILLSVERFTLYTSTNDKAIGVAGRLFQSPFEDLGKKFWRVPPGNLAVQ